MLETINEEKKKKGKMQNRRNENKKGKDRGFGCVALTAYDDRRPPEKTLACPRTKKISSCPRNMTSFRSRPAKGPQERQPPTPQNLHHSPQPTAAFTHHSTPHNRHHRHATYVRRHSQP